MKIVINAFSARLGGGQTYLIRLLENLPSSDVRILLFAPDSLSLPPDPRIRRGRTWWPVGNPILRAVWERFALPRILRNEQADILFCPGGVVATKAPTNCRTITMFQNMIPFTPELVRQMPWGWDRIRNILLKRTLLQSFTKADLTIFISNHARSVLELECPVRKSIVIVHGISNDFRTHAKSLPMPQGAPPSGYILYVSRFDIYKHHRQVVQAFANIPAEQRAQFPLVLIGEDDLPEAALVRQMVRDLHIEEDVRIMGAVNYRELPNWYHHAKVILFASSCENCPFILLESLASGRPVLSSNVMPMPEIGGADIGYFNPLDADSLATELSSVLDNPAREAHLAEASVRASANYDWTTTANQTWQAFQDLLHAR